MNLLDVTKSIVSNYYYMSDYIKLNGGGDYSEKGQPIFMYNESVNYEFNGAQIIAKIDTLTILGKVYNNITKIKITASEQYQHEFSYDTYLFFVDNYGLIRQEINDTINGYETWNLKRYLIVQ